MTTFSTLPNVSASPKKCSLHTLVVNAIIFEMEVKQSIIPRPQPGQIFALFKAPLATWLSTLVIKFHASIYF